MLYREVGQFKTSYAKDQQIFPIFQDRVALFLLICFALFVIPFVANDYWLIAIITPVLAFTLAATGLNIITGYAGQLSLGAAAFMSIGAYATYNLMIRTPIPFPVCVLIGGFFSAFFGFLFGLPSLRVKGFYLVVSTLAAHFFFGWFFDSYPWFKNYNLQGNLKPPPMVLYDGGDKSKYVFDGSYLQSLFDGATNLNNAVGNYVVTLIFVIIFTFLAKNLVRNATGRRMMAVRDSEIAANVMGVNVAKTKLLAFAIGSYYLGVAGALYTFCYIQLLGSYTYNITIAFLVVFMIVVGGLGTILGNFIGATFIFLLPIWLNNTFNTWFNPTIIQNIAYMIFGGFVIALLIIEPNGLARLWATAKEKMRQWPFPY